ncbi:Lipase [Operophtera brumata]|uniref:Lipase n=1 Tax=Operophtera brumata TaxID=104452 RepID=A0A0L7L608_OPEBR|nr:Lipase [Operophtera brumata]
MEMDSEQVAGVLRASGSRMNLAKTKFMTNIPEAESYQMPVDVVDSYIYLGHKITLGIENQTAEVDRPLDPALPGWRDSPNLFSSIDAETKQVIHSNGGCLGFLEPLGKYDFYPNKGMSQPGCILLSLMK